MAQENPPKPQSNEAQGQSETERKTGIEQHISASFRELFDRITTFANDINAENQKNHASDRKYRKRSLRWNKASTITATVASALSLFLTGATLMVLRSTLDVMEKQREITDKQLGQMRDANALSGIMAEAAFRQSQAGQTAADAAANAAGIADATLKSSQKSFQIDQRPYVVTEVGFVTGSIVNGALLSGRSARMTITFRNIGRTPAIKMERYIDLLAQRGDKNMLDWVNFEEKAFVNLRRRIALGTDYRKLARRDIAPTGYSFSTAEYPTPLEPKDIQDIEKGSLRLLFVGIAKYTDAFGGRYETEVCTFYIGNNPNTFNLCDSHNTIR